MGWLDVFCCGRAPRDTESERLSAPTRGRGRSITGQESYGTMSMTSQPQATRGRPGPPSPPSLEQRERMAEISRHAGSHMKSIGAYVAGRPLQPAVSRESSCSRSSSPSPPRPDSSPPNGVLGDVVLHKSIFESRRSSGSSGRSSKKKKRRVSRASR